MSDTPRLYLTNDELRAIMVMCAETSIPSCVYTDLKSALAAIRHHLDPNGEVKNWLAAAEQRYRERQKNPLEEG